MLFLWKNSKRNKQRKATKPTTKTKRNQTKQKKNHFCMFSIKLKDFATLAQHSDCVGFWGRLDHASYPGYLWWWLKNIHCLSGLVKHRIDLVQPWGTEAGILVTVIPCSSVTRAACPAERAWKARWWEVNTRIHQPWGSWWFRGNASGALSSVSILVFDLRPPESSGPWECV